MLSNTLMGEGLWKQNGAIVHVINVYGPCDFHSKKEYWLQISYIIEENLGCCSVW